MRNLLYIIAILLVIVWAVASFAIRIGSAFIHLLLGVAIVMILINLFKRNRRPLD